MPDSPPHPARIRGGLGASLLGLVAIAGIVATSCAKVEEPDRPVRSRERIVTYVAVKLIPAGKTVNAAEADGSIELSEVPADVVGSEAVDDARAIECLVAGRALPAGTVLRRSYFVEPSELGLDQGLTDGTTVDPEC